MKRQFMWRWVVVAWTVTVSAIAAQGLDPEVIVREIRAATWKEGKLLPPEQIDYRRLTAVLPQALELARRAPTLWQRIPSDDFPGTPGITISDAVEGGLQDAARAAPSAAERERWLRLQMELILQLLRDPQSRKIWAEKRNPQSDASDYTVLRLARRLGLGTVRGNLGTLGFLRPEEWGLLIELNWVGEPGAVMVRDGVVYASTAALQAAGVPTQVTLQAVEVSHGGRRAVVRIGGTAPGDPRQGFRDAAGVVYVPVEELGRQELFTVEMNRKGQTVYLEPPPPRAPVR